MWRYVLVALAAMAVSTCMGSVCCFEVPLEQMGGLVRRGRTVADAPVGQTSATSPWMPTTGWWTEVVERRLGDGLPYDMAMVLLNATSGTPLVTGRDLLVDVTGAHAGLAAFQSFPSQLREGTTNYRWVAAAGAADTWLRHLRVHRSISAEHPASVRLEMRRHDGSTIGRYMWLWSTSLSLNTIDLVLPPGQDSVNGPLGEFTISVWGSGYAAISVVELCQPCVTIPSPVPATPSPTHTPAPSASPSAPPVLGSGCNTGSPGVCAVGTWQRSTAGALVCTLDVLPSAEVCDGLDNDCDGLVDEDFQGQTVTCGVGVCRTSVPLCSDGAPTQCRPLVPPQADDPCDGLDNNCDGRVDEDSHTVTCGVGECRRSVETCSPAGTPQECVPGPPEDEVCDGLDNNCDGRVDENNVCALPDYAVTRHGLLLSPVCTDAGRVGTLHVVNTGNVRIDTTPTLWTTPIGDDDSDQLVPLEAISVAPLGVTTMHIPLDQHTVVNVALDQGHQTALFDDVSPPACNFTQGLVNASLDIVANADADALRMLTPTVDSCVTRLDGYCNFTMGYLHRGPRPLLIDADTDANRVVAGSTQIQQNQPTLFWPGRARSVLFVRVACPSETWDGDDQSWSFDWHLGTTVATARVASQCPIGRASSY